MPKNEVIIWHPFPSPDGKKRRPSPNTSFQPGLKSPLVMEKPRRQSEIEAEAIERWIRLAEFGADEVDLNGRKKSKA